MATSDIQNPPALSEPKLGGKRKAKKDRTESPAPVASTPEKAASVADVQDDSTDNVYIRDLQKSVVP